MNKNRYIIKINDIGYVNGYYNTNEENYDFYGQMSEYPTVTDGYYKFITDDTEAKGHFEIDENKKTEIEENTIKEQSLSENKKSLKDSDTLIVKFCEELLSLENKESFIDEFISLAKSFKEEYSATFEERKTARDNIREGATEYKIGKQYTIDDYVLYNNETYKVVQSHISQSDWTPSSVPALYVKVSFSENGLVEWTQPTGAHDSYKKDNIVSFNGKKYKSTIDNNVWSPTTYGWEEI